MGDIYPGGAANQPWATKAAQSEDISNVSMGARVITYAEAAGWRGQRDLVMAAAIAKAESSWDPTARNKIGASGLWQILASAHPDKMKMGDWRDGAINARMARAVYLEAQKAGKNPWQPWEAYTNGAYKKYIPDAEKAYQEYAKLNTEQRVKILGTAGYPGMAAAFHDASGALSGDRVEQTFGTKSVMEAVQKLLGNATLWLITIVLLILGVVMILSESKAGKAALSIASPVGKIGKIAKAVG